MFELMTRISDQRWSAAQHQELETWKVAAASDVAWLGSLKTAVELYQWLQSVSRVPRRDERFLEVGIGPLGIGFIAVFGSLRPENNVAVDPLPRIAFASGDELIDRSMRELQERVDYRQGRANALDSIPSRSVDWVICDNLLDHTDDPAAILREMRRVVVPAGHVVVTVHCRSLAGLIKWRAMAPLQPNNPNRIMHPQSFTIRSAETLLEQHGFRIVASNRGESAFLGEWLGRLRLGRWVLEPEHP